MTILQSALLGLLQGIAEFLPISSSGHLKLAQALFGLEDVPLLFDVFLHLATLLAVVIYFRQSIIRLFCVLGRWITKKDADDKEKDDRQFIISVIISTLITGVLGVISSKLIPDMDVKIVCIGLDITAMLLILSAVIERKHKDVPEKAPNAVQAAIIGLMQGIGTLPGISRSGSTIAGALFSGVNRKVAGEYSFIVSIPAILGAFLLEVKDIGEVSSSIGALPVIIGCIVAFVSGYASLAWLMKLIRKGRLEYFACYLVPVSILGFFLL